MDIIDIEMRNEMEATIMLCQFTVKNYKSIRDEVTFDMQVAAISEHEDKVIRDIDGEEFLPVSALYGPNGGGKSNVLKALQTFAVRLFQSLNCVPDLIIHQQNIMIEPALSLLNTKILMLALSLMKFLMF